jgi:hypothetical protein
MKDRQLRSERALPDLQRLASGPHDIVGRVDHGVDALRDEAHVIGS